MKEKKLKFKNEKGITLMALILTITVMLIIIGVSISASMESFENTEIEGFYTELDIVQKKVDYVASTNKEYNRLGTKLTSDQKKTLNKILSTEGAGLGLDSEKFRYFTVEQLESVLGLSDIRYDVFVDFGTRTVIAEKGITVDKTTYHILPKTVYNVELDNSINDKWTISSLSFGISKYGKIYSNSIKNNINLNSVSSNSINSNSINYDFEQTYIITVTPKNVAGEKMTGGTLMYRRSGATYWETATDLRFIINENKMGNYDILYVDKNQNKIEKQVKVWVNSKGSPFISIQYNS